MRATKIVATVGPASGSADTLRELLAAGVDVFRFNLSHGSPGEHAERIRLLRNLAEGSDRQAGILIDLQGPKIRLGLFEGGGCVLETGQQFIITTEPVLGNARRASTSYALLAAEVRPGDRVLLNDGAVELRVLDSGKTEVRCEVVSGGPVGDRKGINLPGVPISTPSLSDKDKADLTQLLNESIDLVALSFVRSREDIAELRRFLAERQVRLPLVAKLEKPEGWENFDAILDEADGIMVARGDLGVEMSLERVPFIQKWAIARARHRGKFVITATQMLESMVENPLPTRAEVSDVANAIADGTDAVMLSAETSVGKHPVEAVRRMAAIAVEAERAFRRLDLPASLPAAEPVNVGLIAQAAHEAARSGAVAAIAVFTMSGASAHRVARCRPAVPIFAFTPSREVARQLTVVYGLRPMVTPDLSSADDIIAHLEKVLIANQWVKAGQSVAVVAGLPVGRPGNTNLFKLHQIGSPAPA